MILLGGDQESLVQHRNNSKTITYECTQVLCEVLREKFLFEFMSSFTCGAPPPPRHPLPPKGPALCWRRRCPGVSRLRWDSAPPGRDTAPRRTSFASLSPVETDKTIRGQTQEGFSLDTVRQNRITAIKSS